MNDLDRILAEQSSPADVLVFLAVTVAVFLGIAFIVYAVIMAVLRLGLPTRVPLRRVLLPSGEQFREHLGDYVLAASTSVLLSLTLMVKHDLVQQIAGWDMSRVAPEAIDALFDFGMPAELRQDIGDAAARDVVQPLLAAGRVEESDLLVRSIIRGLPQHWLTPRILIIACVVVAAFYLSWLARRRFRVLRTRPGSAPEYASTFRALLTLALCVGLLLASALPLARGGEKFLARSALEAMAQAQQAGGRPNPISQRIAQELHRQRARAEYLYCPDCDEPQRSIWREVEDAAAAQGNLQPLLDRLNDAIAACRNACASELVQLRNLLAPIQSRLEVLEARDRELDEQQPELQQRIAKLENDLGQLLREVAVLNERTIPGLQARHERDLEDLNRRLADLGRQLAETIRQLDGIGGTAAAVADLQRRVAWLESQHRRQSENPDDARNVECERYARQAMRQNQMNLESRCGFTGARWSSSVEEHFQWCLNVPQYLRDAETEARDAQLSNCRPPVQ